MAGAATALMVGGMGGAQAGSDYPFTLGVASGDPFPDSVVLWTRLAPDPLNGGGMLPKPQNVHWEMATDSGFKKIVQTGKTVAHPAWAHSVHVDVKGLQPGRSYWYRFHTAKFTSPIGRTRTAPSPFSKPEQVRFAFASCQNYEQGYYTAHRHMSRENLDFVLFLGDYIYENGAWPIFPRKHNSDEILSLNDYRNRYALYKSDQDLQACHAAHPWIVTWDDHEVENNYAGLIPGKKVSEIPFTKRRENAYRAYYEHMPLRVMSQPDRLKMRLYRYFVYGNLMDMNVLDTRQFRTPLPKTNAAMQNLSATILGPAQEAWLYRRLGRTRAIWNVLAQQVIMADMVAGHNMFDKWSGYQASRNRLFHVLRENKVPNPIVLSGDNHRNWVADLLADFDDSDSQIIGTEFIGTSISSNGDGRDMTRKGRKRLKKNPHFKFFNYQRGYVRAEVSPKKWQTDFRVVDHVSSPGADIKTRASFIVEQGKPGAQRL
ncbi:MAG: alkaline phosphatase [Rhodospirillaceae bacterium]|jgi:alkaline phosphatase D|nr:alkaline phosphatase [Rhodospirillales bacterium]MBT4699819.1 alkaline phosphatase [Rhodospirillaceae bacterium]MBT5033162.1 alkaline phosphatase [Rhodospirillaceae bacterium]MBT6219067.1 alkaline phosphatase [Rhodospirillaceae bacterium]MBT6363968.1 alkaline phosphatase [Rhodospirillaceae bacterium]